MFNMAFINNRNGAEAGMTCGSTETPGAFVLLPAE